MADSWSVNHMFAALGEADGATVGTGVGMLPGLVTGADGVPISEVGVGIEVGTDTVGSGSEEVDAAAGLAPSAGAGAAAISAVPAP